jgi:hypothetical protein
MANKSPKTTHSPNMRRSSSRVDPARKDRTMVTMKTAMMTVTNRPDAAAPAPVENSEWMRIRVTPSIDAPTESTASNVTANRVMFAVTAAKKLPIAICID